MTLPIEEALPRLRECWPAMPQWCCKRRPVRARPHGAARAARRAWLKARALSCSNLAGWRTCAAGRMSQLRGENVGEMVGYRIRFESKVSKATRIEVLTEGILTAAAERPAWKAWGW